MSMENKNKKLKQFGLRGERRLAGLPPYAFQAVLRAEAQDRDQVLAFLNAAKKFWNDPTGRIFGPFPAMMERR